MEKWKEAWVEECNKAIEINTAWLKSPLSYTMSPNEFRTMYEKEEKQRIELLKEKGNVLFKIVLVIIFIGIFTISII